MRARVLDFRVGRWGVSEFRMMGGGRKEKMKSEEPISLRARSACARDHPITSGLFECFALGLFEKLTLGLSEKGN
jgi:hypothetical protein